MSRLRVVRSPSAAEIMVEIEEESSLHAAFLQDLTDALVAGEDTRPYRANLADLGEKLANLRRQHGAAVEAEAERRHAVIAANARDIAAGTMNRVAASIASITPPPAPQFKEFYQ